jgi:serine/threonine-protein kinase
MEKGPHLPEPEPKGSASGAAPTASTRETAGGGDRPAGTTAVHLDDLHGRMLGDFRILRRLGHGGMAEVYLAEQTQLQRNVAVKVLRKERVTDESYLTRFKREATAAGSLSHPNIIQVFMIGEQDGIQYIAQEYVPGMNLREFLAKKGPPELALAMKIIKQVAQALQSAHNAGIVHRDIKPENIMITRKGEIKVADFGLAQLTQGGERLNLTQDGVTMGTPLYMSPEQVSGSKLDLRTDIYSLGVTCYHMLAGTPPFRGETAISVAVQHLKEQAEQLEKIRGDLPPVVCRIIHKMMMKDPEKRYQTAQALLKDLKRVPIDADESAEQAIHAPEPAPQKEENATPGLAMRLLTGIWRAPDWPASRQIWVVALLALLVGGASAGIGWVNRVPDPLSGPAPQAGAVPVKETAASQYLYAVNLKDNIDAWKAVVDHFPNDPLYRPYAEQQLAELYLAKRRYDEAQEIFDRFIDSGGAQRQWRAFGLAGKAVLLTLRGEYTSSQRLLEDLQTPTTPPGATGNGGPGEGDPGRRPPVLYDLLDDRMRSAVREAVNRNLEKINQKMSREWDEIFSRQEPQESSGASGTDGPSR